jgi:Flp pilus assembly protein TadB
VTAVVAVVCALGLGLLLVPSGRRVPAMPSSRGSSAAGPSRLPRLPRPGLRSAAVMGGIAAAVLIGGAGGAVVGLVVAAAAWWGIPRLQSGAERDRRTELARQAPVAVDLLAACLASGASVESSLAATARAVPGAAGDVLATATAALRLGADPLDVWREVGALPELAGLARAAARSAGTGAPLTALLPRVADDLRAGRRADAEAGVRTAAVRLTAPLGLAFLPAFVALGVVPVVASWIGTLL